MGSHPKLPLAREDCADLEEKGEHLVTVGEAKVRVGDSDRLSPPGRLGMDCYRQCSSVGAVLYIPH